MTSATEIGASFSQRGKLTKMRPVLLTATPVTCWSNPATSLGAGADADAAEHTARYAAIPATVADLCIARICTHSRLAPQQRLRMGKVA